MDCGPSDLCPPEQKTVLRIAPVMGRGAHMFNVTHNGIPVWDLQGSQQHPSRCCPGVSHIRNPVASLGKYASQVEALSHNNRGVPVRRRSLSRTMRAGEHHTHTPHTHLPWMARSLHTPCRLLPLHPPSQAVAGEFPSTTLFFSASGEEDSSYYTLTGLI